jgi:hypothetical protein
MGQVPLACGRSPASPCVDPFDSKRLDCRVSNNQTTGCNARANSGAPPSCKSWLEARNYCLLCELLL